MLIGSIFVVSIVVAQLNSVQLGWTGIWGLSQSESMPLKIAVKPTGILIEGDPVIVSNSSSVVDRFFVSIDGKPKTLPEKYEISLARLTDRGFDLRLSHTEGTHLVLVELHRFVFSGNGSSFT